VRAPTEITASEPAAFDQGRADEAKRLLPWDPERGSCRQAVVLQSESDCLRPARNVLSYSNLISGLPSQARALPRLGKARSMP